MMSIKRVAIEVNDDAFLPEAYAYESILSSSGYICEFLNKDDISARKDDFDAVILFHGFHPFWKAYPAYVVGEYHSLSTGRFNRLKDVFKRLFNVKARSYIFLNEEVREKLWFSRDIKYTVRCMGYEKKDFDRFRAELKLYDIVYSGSYRRGLEAVLKKLAALGFKIAVVGDSGFLENENIVFFGKLSAMEARKIISQSRYGLNFTPDVFPYNIQDSTKTIEYCAAGLGVITNRYKWVNDFEAKRSARFLSLEHVKEKSDVESFGFIVPDVSDLDWSKILSAQEFTKRVFGETESHRVS